MPKICLVKQGALEEVDQPVFSTGDTYIVQSGERIWIWIGEGSSVDERFAGAFISDLRDKEAGGDIDVETVHQSEETPGFRMAVGPMRIVEKNLAESILKKVKKIEHPVVMYRISSEEYELLDDIQFIQVPLSKDSLSSEDAFLIDAYDKTFIWQGKNCNVREKVVAGRVARKFDAERVGVQKEIFVEEGEEPDELKELLGF
ncbi:MAG: hypothetical protein ACTSYO_01360 [Candidatus Ranarchaeia archaeon]